MATKNLGRVVGKSAYEVAVDNGFEGTEQQWLASLEGTDGTDGQDGESAYQIAVDHGYEGTEEEWIEEMETTTEATTIGGHISLIDDNTLWINKKYISYDDGTIANGTTNYFCTQSYIPVEVGKAYFLFLNGVAKGVGYWAFYDENYILVSTCTRLISYNYVVAPEGAKYLRFTANCAALGITAGSQVIDENGKLISPKLELFEQTNNTYVSPSPVTITTTKIKNNIKVDGANLLDNTVDVSKLNFVKEFSSKNIWNPTIAVSGYNALTSAQTTISNNSAYRVTPVPIPVHEGDILSFWKLGNNGTATSQNARYVSIFDENMNKLAGQGSESEPNYTIPSGVSYVMITLQLSVYGDVNHMYVQKSNSTEFEGYQSYNAKSYKIKSDYVEGGGSSPSPTPTPEKPTLHFFLPPEICVAGDRTIELYNDQVCLEADKYHIQWIGKYGAAFDWKYTIQGDNELVGQSFTLTCNVTNDKLETLATKTTTVRFVSATISTPQLIIPIGDSLTNQKYWITHIYNTLSSNNISFRGTRGTTNPSLVNGITHEGRSGVGSGWYNLKTSKYTFDSNGLSTLTSSGKYTGFVDAQGNPLTPLQVNPFWHLDTNNNIDKFDFDFYCNSTNDGGAGLFQNSNGETISLTPTGVVIYLGANGMKTDPTDAVNNIKTLVDNIRDSVKGASIPIYVMLLEFRAPYILSTNADGFNTNSNGMYKFLNDVQYYNLQKELYLELGEYENIYFVPLSTTMDSKHSYPYNEVGVNPYVSNEKMKYYTDTIHPTDNGFKQIGDTLFGIIAYHSQQ